MRSAFQGYKFQQKSEGKILIQKNLPLKFNQQQVKSQQSKYEQLEQTVRLKEQNLKNLTKQLGELKTKNNDSQKYKDDEIDSFKDQVISIQNKLEKQEIDDENEIKELQNYLNQLESEHIEQQQQLEKKNQQLLEFKTKQNKTL